MRLRILSILSLFSSMFVAGLQAQTMTPIVASKLLNLDGSPVTGRLCTYPALTGGQPQDFAFGATGQGTSAQKCFSVTAGVLQAGVSFPDTSATSPQNLCLYTQLIDPTQPPARQVVKTWPCLQPSGSSPWSLDGTVPSTPALPMLRVVGPIGPVGVFNWRGAWAATTAYAQNDGFVQAGVGYVVATAYTSGSSFGSTDTTNAVQIATGCPTTGCTMTGPIVLPADPTTAYQAATKNYVDVNALPKSGGTMTGPIVLPGAPALASQAATKGYVDGKASPNPLVVSQLRTAPWDDFDAAAGTLLSGRVSPSGFTWTLGGAGASTASIANGGWTSTGNTYAALIDSQTITEGEGVLSYQKVSGQSGQNSTQAAFIFSSTGGVTTGSLLHFSFNSTEGNLMKAVSGGAVNLVQMANAPTELSGAIEAPSYGAGNTGGVTFLQPLSLNGTRYKIRGVLNVSANTFTVYMPDGTVWQWYDTSIGSMAAMNSVIWQNAGNGAAGYADLHWNSAAIGPSKAEQVGLQVKDLQRIVNEVTQNRSSVAIAPTSVGWYTIATDTYLAPNHRLGGRVKIYGNDSANRDALLTIDVGAELAGGSGSSTAANSQLKVTQYLGQWSAIIDQVRLSANTSTGALQLDVHTASAGSAALYATFEGNFTTVAAPTVGATALATWSNVQPVALPAAPYTQTLSGGVGWYTILTASSGCGGYCIKGDAQIQAFNGTYGIETFNLHLDGTTTGCSIAQASATLPSMISQVRCSWSASAIQVDFYNVVSATYPITLTGNLFGQYTVNSAPTVGATVLASGSNTYSLAQDTLAPLSLAVNGGTAMTANHGTGTSLQHSDGTGAAGHVAVFAADGSVTDGLRAWACQPGLGDGLNAILAGTYPIVTCQNKTGSTVTLTSISCFTDNAGTSTMNATAHTLGALLTGAVTCSPSFAAGTQSANVLLTNGDYITFSFVADGTSKQTTWVVEGTY